MSDEIVFSELAERLRSEKGATVLDEVLQRLTHLKGVVDAQIRAGNPGDEYRRLEAQSRALVASQSVMVRWASLRGVTADPAILETNV